MSKTPIRIFLVAPYPLRMYAPTSGYGTMFMLSADRRRLLTKEKTDYAFAPEIAYIENGLYLDTPVKLPRSVGSRPSKST